MIKIDAPKPSGAKFNDWRARASARRQKDIAKWEADGKQTPGPNPDPKAWKKIRPKQDQKLWAEFKDVFLSSAFSDKCAYCEGNHSSGYPADVEHYRPKNGVTEGRTQIDHPGYFWLAYEWENLLLSCRHCNSRHPSSRHGKPVSHEGKLNEFRVRGPRVSEPSADPSKWQQELKAEQPLLINPWVEKPAEHMYFKDDGMLYHHTDEGAETIEVCDLNRPALVSERIKYARNVAARIYDWIREVERDKSKVSEPIFHPSEPFSAWLNFYAADLLEKAKSALPKS